MDFRIVSDLVRCFVQEEQNFREHGIRFNALCPGAVDTPFLNQIHKGYFSQQHQQRLNDLPRIASVSSPSPPSFAHPLGLRMSAKRSSRREGSPKMLARGESACLKLINLPHYGLCLKTRTGRPIRHQSACFGSKL